MRCSAAVAELEVIDMPSKRPMSFMFELYYAPPDDLERERRLIEQVANAGGELTFREPATAHTGICLTFEFSVCAEAEAAEGELRRQGEHTKGLCDYGE